MHAVIKTGGKQYRVALGEVVKVEKLEGEVGANLKISDVLAVGEGEGLKIGTPMVEGASVSAVIVEQGKHKKLVVFKKKKRKGYTKKQGHRQLFTSIRIESINA